MHLSLSGPQFDSLNKNCMKITSEGVNSSLSFKILKYSLAEVAVFINGGKSLSLSLHESMKNVRRKTCMTSVIDIQYILTVLWWSRHRV